MERSLLTLITVLTSAGLTAQFPAAHQKEKPARQVHPALGARDARPAFCCPSSPDLGAAAFPIETAIRPASGLPVRQATDGALRGDMSPGPNRAQTNPFGRDHVHARVAPAVHIGGSTCNPSRDNRH